MQIQVTSQCTNILHAGIEKFLLIFMSRILSNVLIGVFDIHQSNEDSPIQCSDRIYHPSLTSGAYDGYQLAEAMLLAVDNVNRGRVPVLLNSGVTLGAILFDTCDSGLRGSSIASSVYSGGLELDDARSVQGWVTTGDQQTIEVGMFTGHI